MARQFGQNVVMETGALDRHHRLHRPRDRRQMLLRRPAVQGQVGHAGCLLPLQTAHPLAKVLVQVAGGNGNELEPFQQRRARVDSLVEHPPVEIEPAQLPVVQLVRIAQFVQRECVHIEPRCVDWLRRQRVVTLKAAEKLGIDRVHLWRRRGSCWHSLFAVFSNRRAGQQPGGGACSSLRPRQSATASPFSAERFARRRRGLRTGALAGSVTACIASTAPLRGPELGQRPRSRLPHQFHWRRRGRQDRFDGYSRVRCIDAHRALSSCSVALGLDRLYGHAQSSVQLL